MQLTLGSPQVYTGYGTPQQYQYLQARPVYYNAPQPATLRPEDAAAVNELGPEGVATGKKALNIATNLVKGVFPESGPIIVNRQIQTKWGNYPLPAMANPAILEKFLDATRDLIKSMPIVEWFVANMSKEINTLHIDSET